MMNQDNPYAMNQTCKVCGEPAAGFHFGAFTCEGCKSFFGRSYNNLSSITDCKNNSECIINKKNRTACKACRLRKCLMVGMSKSGSRYGRRSNWFKIHCLLQEQQQQAQAMMTAHHNNQQQQHQQQQQQQAAHQQQQQQHGGHKPGQHGASVAAAAALGMLGHPGAYPGLYPPRTKEELMMLGLEEYAKHPAASPSVSSPDSHNSDSSVEVNLRGGGGGNPLLQHMSGKHAVEVNAAAAASSPQLRKDLPHFLPLPFAGLGSMPVMPPPAFLPPSHLLFPGYHPALYQHHQGLLKPSPEQQQQQAVAAAAAVQHLFNSTNAGSVPNRFVPHMTSSPLTNLHVKEDHHQHHNHHRPMLDSSPKSDTLNNNHLPNGSKAAEELTKRFYLDAVLNSQRSTSPPPVATKLPASHSKHDHSISALVTPNSESGRERLKSRQSTDEAVVEDEDGKENDINKNDHRASPSNGNDDDSDCDGEDLVVSMTPPRSPVNARPLPNEAEAPVTAKLHGQDNPIDLSMKTGSSIASTLSSKCSSTGSVQAGDSETENDAESEHKMYASQEKHEELEVDDDEEDNSTVETVKTSILSLKNVNNNNNNNNDNDNNNSTSFVQLESSEGEETLPEGHSIKRKLNEVKETEAETQVLSNVKRAKLEETVEPSEKLAVKLTTTTPLDLTTKV